MAGSFGIIYNVSCLEPYTYTTTYFYVYAALGDARIYFSQLPCFALHISESFISIKKSRPKIIGLIYHPSIPLRAKENYGERINWSTSTTE